MQRRVEGPGRAFWSPLPKGRTDLPLWCLLGTCPLRLSETWTFGDFFPELSYGQKWLLENAVFLSSQLTWTSVVLHALETLITMWSSYLSRSCYITCLVLRHNFKEALMSFIWDSDPFRWNGKRSGLWSPPSSPDFWKNLLPEPNLFLKAINFKFKKLLVKLLVWNYFFFLC